MPQAPDTSLLGAAVPPLSGAPDPQGGANSRTATGLVNLALGASATQSSRSPWSRPDDPVHAVSGRIDGEFAFHTDREERPWWQVDLGAIHPIEVIIVHNRLRAEQARARSLRVEIADEPERWRLVHAGHVQFGARGHGHPLELWLGSEIGGRYIRLSLEETTYFHLAQVEVFARRDVLAFEAYRSRNGLVRFERTSTDFGRPYAVSSQAGVRSDTIVGLTITHCGRFGNLLQQYTHMIQLARKTGLAYVQLGRSPFFDIEAPVTIDGLTILPAAAPLPADGTFLTGSFFNSDPFAPLLSPFLRFLPEDETAYSVVAQTFLRPLLTGIPVPGEQHFNDELTIHIRSGDLFEGDQTGNRWYRQPPLSFYTLVVTAMRDSGRIARVRLVFEDRGNPCIDRLEAWLDAESIPCRIQCGTLREDMSALIDAPHLVFGYGTFGYAACRLSARIETLHVFAPELGGRYADIPCIEEVFVVSDAKGDYIEAGQMNRSAGGWRGTPEQRELMVTYPAVSLKREPAPKRA